MFKFKSKKELLIFILGCIPIVFALIATVIILLNPIKTYANKINLLALLGFIFVLIIFILFIFLHIKKIKKIMIVVVIINLLLSGAFLGGAIYYQNVRNIFTDITSNVETFSFSILVKKDSPIQSVDDLKGKNIGMLSDTIVDPNHDPVTIMDEAKKNRLEKGSYQVTNFINAIDGANMLVDQGEIDAIVLNRASLDQILTLSPEFNDETRVLVTFEYTREIKNNENSINVSTEPFTILIAGVDDRGDELDEKLAEGKSLGTGSRTDSLMLATFNPSTMRVILTSIPRDTYLPMPCLNGSRDKITHANVWGGIDCTMETIEGALNIEIDNYVILNFQALVYLTDLVGGIDVYNEFAFCELDSNEIAYDSICVDSGFQHLNGEQALAMSRHRKTLPTGDLQRGKNQMTVLMALVEALAKNSGTLSLNKILEVTKRNLRTDFSEQQMSQFYRLVQSLAGDSLFSASSGLLMEKNSIATVGDMKDGMSIQIAYQESLDFATQLINEVRGLTPPSVPTEMLFNPNIINELRTRPSQIANSTPSFVPVDSSNTHRLPDFTGQTLQAVQDWCWSVNNDLTDGQMTCSFVDLAGSPISQAEALFRSATLRAGSLVNESSQIIFTFEKVDLPIEFPNFVGLSASEASDWCSANSITCSFVENGVPSTNPYAKIVSASIAPGMIQPNSSITFTVTSVVEKFTPTGITTVSQANQWCNSHGIICAFNNSAGMNISNPEDIPVLTLNGQFASGEVATFTLQDISVPNFTGMSIEAAVHACKGLTCMVGTHASSAIIQSYSPSGVVPAYTQITFTIQGE